MGRFLCIAAATLIAALATSAVARADYERIRVYWGQDIAFYGEYHTSPFDSGCLPMSSSSAESHGYGWITVALLDTGGTWRYSKRSSDSIVWTLIQPNSFASAASWRKKALCKNSGSTTISLTCSNFVWVQDPPRGQCV
jgi:hypothetical protein